MLDIQFIRENPDLVKEISKQKNVDVDVDKLLKLDQKRKDIATKIETIRSERNKLTANLTAKPSEADINRGTHFKTLITELEKESAPIEEEYNKLIHAIPNIPADDVPVGKTEDDNKVVKTWGDKKDFDFKPKPHWEIGESRGLIDKERAAKISGARFVYLKGGLVELEFALIQYVTKLLTDENVIENLIKDNKLHIVAKPFIPVLPPMMMRTAPYQATGRLKAEEMTYKLADDDLWLIASAEHSLCSMYINEILDEKELPIRYLGFSTSFRREAGTYGKDTNGIVRLHHFNKLEMEVFSDAENSAHEHLLLIAIQEYLTQSLEIPYQLILKCTADIGAPNARGVDIDMWFPGQGTYKETHTADYMTDYQARDLKTRVRRENGTINLVHTNDATAFAIERTLAAIIENYQTEDGHIIVPEVLRPFLNGRQEI
jgi:seryl-tRNA synthetase